MSATSKANASGPRLPNFSACSRRLLFGFSPWLVVGLSAVLALVIILLAWRNIEREREHITRNFLDRADALIWALEAVTRTGADLDEETKILQLFVMETARQRDILYIAVIDKDGRILAHNDAREVGKTLAGERPLSSGPPKNIAWHTVHASGHDIFEVYRMFSPAPRYHHSLLNAHHGHRHGADKGGLVKQDAPPIFAVIGFDSGSYETMLAKDRFNNLLTASVAAVLALGSFFSLFWADGYRRSRRLLKDTRALASEVVTSLPIGLIACEPNGAIGMVNETALAMLHMNRKAAVGASIRGVPGLDWKALITALGQNRKVIEHEMEFNVNDGTTPVSVSASQIHDEDGLFLGHIFILRDISEMKRLQAEARRNDRLAALGNLAAGVAHEIRNPLSSIKGIATLLAAKTSSSEPEKEAAKTLIAEADRLNRVVSQLLDFAKPGAMKLAHANINELITHALRLADADVRAKAIRVSFAENKTLPLIPINAERFTQALLNLFLNAVQAMEPGGRLEISASLTDDGNSCAICIKDDGKGMTQEVQSSIFTPYFTTKASGTGLGLAIVQQIIERHGGGISVNSAPGAGSSFTLRIPVQKPHKEKT